MSCVKQQNVMLAERKRCWIGMPPRRNFVPVGHEHQALGVGLQMTWRRDGIFMNGKVKIWAAIFSTHSSRMWIR